MYKQLFLIGLSLIILASCSSSQQATIDIPEYGSRADYPELEQRPSESANKNSTQTLPKMSSNSMQKLQTNWTKLSRQAGCQATKNMMVSFVVTKQATVDAPEFEKSVSAPCRRAALQALTSLTFNRPATQNGEPVPIIMTLPLVVR